MLIISYNHYILMWVSYFRIMHLSLYARKYKYNRTDSFHLLFLYRIQAAHPNYAWINPFCFFSKHLSSISIFFNKMCCRQDWLSTDLWHPVVHVHFSARYHNVIMSVMEYQITSLMIVYSNVYSMCRSKKTSKRHWPLCGEFTGGRWISCTKGQ